MASPGVLPLCRTLTTANGVSRPVIGSRPTVPGGATRSSEKFAAQRPAILELSRDRDGASGALNGTVSVWGANLSNPDMGISALCQAFKGDGSTTAFQTSIPYVAFSNNNWIVLVYSNQLVTKTGTVTTTAGSTNVAGSGTSFLTQLAVGDTIVINGEAQQVQEITSATSLTTVNPWVGANTAAAFTGPVVNVALADTTDVTISAGTSGALATFGTAPVAGARIEIHSVVPVQIMADGNHPYEEAQIMCKTVMWIKTNGATISATTAILNALGQ